MIVVANASLNFAIIFGLFSVFLALSGNIPVVVYLAMIPVLLIQIAFSAGLGVTLGVLNVFFRDVGQLFGVVLQFWFWLTPVVYPANILPAFMQKIISYNPMTSLIGAYQDILVHAKWPDWSSLITVSVLAVLLCIWGMRLFRNHAGEMVDEL